MWKTIDKIIAIMYNINCKRKSSLMKSDAQVKKKKKTNWKNNRIEYLDLLRILASIAVVIIHICSSKWYAINSNTNEWSILNIYDSLSRWAVPVFVMISGAIFLSSDYSIEKLYKKIVLGW